jgi:ribosome-associated toxin RatA of RatAB toxin-antitoxin module
MREINRNALVPYTPEQMYALVADIERYPEFVPWLKSATVMERNGSEVVAQLELERAGLRERFTTRNVLLEAEKIEMNLIAGPFKRLTGAWTFSALADRGTRIGLAMTFELANPIMSMVLGKVFEQSCNQLVDAFVRRAQNVYGKPAA